MAKIEIPKEYGTPAVIAGFDPKSGRPMAVGLVDKKVYVLAVRNDFKLGHYVGIKDSSLRKLPKEIVAMLQKQNGNGYNGIADDEASEAPAVPSGAKDDRKSRADYRKRKNEAMVRDMDSHFSAELAELSYQCL